MPAGQHSSALPVPRRRLQATAIRLGGSRTHPWSLGHAAVHAKRRKSGGAESNVVKRGTEFVDIRLSDLLRDCSVGAIVRHDRTLMVVTDITRWDGPDMRPEDREIRYVDQVRRSLLLEDKMLCLPPERRESNGFVRGWIPARRFPEWCRCVRCGLLHNAPWRARGGQGRGSDANRDGTADASGCERCGDRSRDSVEACGGRFEQVPWVLVHELGYLADVPWHEIAHAQSRTSTSRDCTPDWRAPYLRVNVEHGRRTVACTKCRAQGRLPDRFPFGPKVRQQPWVREPPPEAPEELGWVVGVNDVRVHFAECRTALVIPPESRIRRGTVVDRLYNSSADQRDIHGARNPYTRKSRLRRLAGKYRCDPDELERALQDIADGYPSLDEEMPTGDLMWLEYQALTEPIPKLRPEEDFVTEHHADAWHNLCRGFQGSGSAIADSVDRLVGVHRVREIMVLDGYRRGSVADVGERRLVPPDITDTSDWLPALERWGEGVFFTLDEDRLRRWESQAGVRERAATFRERSHAAWLPTDVDSSLSARFLLCHTLAHLVMRRLEAEAGYPASSLKERIYCADGDDSDPPMAGVLIYVAVTDEMGSLGGLMDLATPARFARLLTGAVERSMWCSLDPVCGEQDGQGPDLLNRAACHACALVPEPSCICGNRLLDRAFVNGTDHFRSLWETSP